MIRGDTATRHRGSEGNSLSSKRQSRMGRVCTDAVFDLARHLTERDRDILVRLFDVQVLTTDQIELLFFSSRRRCQDRLLFLFRHRLIDRFYPPSPFGSGKPQAHWLLDEAGAVLVAAIRRVERKRLGWQRRDDWASHPQLAHRLESNRFVTNLIAAALPDERMGVTAWHSSREAARRLSESGYLRPDAGLILDVPAGPVECVLEWDRGTETRSVLGEKLDSYRSLDTSLGGDRQPRSVLFVVPGFGRVKSVRRAFVELEPKWEYRRRDRWNFERDPTWLLLAATAGDLGERGPLGRVWQSITDEHEPLRALPELPARSDLGPTNLALALGREWRHQQPGFWDRLSPLRRREPNSSPPTAFGEGDEEESWVWRHRQAEMEEWRREAAERARADGPGGALNPGAQDGLMDDDSDDSPDGMEESWA